MQVAEHASQLPQLSSRWQLLQFEAAAQLVEVALAAGSIPPEHGLTAAGALCDHLMHWLDEAEPRMSHERSDRVRAAVYGTCMRHIASGVAAAAAKLAGADETWKQDVACQLLATATQLCAWLLTPLAAQHGAADDGASAWLTQKDVAALLADGGPVAQALSAASAAQRRELAFFERYIHRDTPESSPEALPPLALAARMLRMLCSADGRLGPLSASCLGTDYGDQRLHVEVHCLMSSALCTLRAPAHGIAGKAETPRCACQMQLAGPETQCKLATGHGAHGRISLFNVQQVTTPARFLCAVHAMADPRAPGGGALQAVLQAKVRPFPLSGRFCLGWSTFVAGSSAKS